MGMKRNHYGLCVFGKGIRWPFPVESGVFVLEGVEDGGLAAGVEGAEFIYQIELRV